MNEFRQRLQGLLGLSKERFRENKVGELCLSSDGEEFKQAISSLSSAGFTMVCMFAAEDVGRHRGITIFHVFEKSGYREFLVLGKSLSAEKTQSIVMEFPAACWYEREISDGYGIEFAGSPDTRHLFLHEGFPSKFHPLRKSFKNGSIKTNISSPPHEAYVFKQVHGEGVYQIPVGPVHAGIIEPGHFRFSVIGETIFNLEIRMFWKHRGIEKLAEGKSPDQVVALAQSISGDETVANSWAYCMAVERISGMNVPPRAQYLRLVFAEMERIYSLLGDLAGMIIDVAYPMGASPLFVLREEILRWNERLSGSRFYKGAFIIGGMDHDVSSRDLRELSRYLGSFYDRFCDVVQQVLSQPSVIDRFETTGRVRQDLIRPLNITGPLARASGGALDVRRDHPYGAYSQIKPIVKVLYGGDVLCRFNIKSDAIRASAHMIRRAVGVIPDGKVFAEGKAKDGFAMSVIESPRGQSVHWVYIRQGRVERYKVRTASFCNWQAIEHAVLGNIVPDFPLINKSMNLSYAGTDL